MLAKSIVLMLPFASSLAAASIINRSQNSSVCWTGEIHSPCNGATTGCTPGGIMVACEDGTSMIFSSNCNCSGTGTGQGSCTYDADCNASCGPCS
ncbi:hypothetical protein F4779DRAFT_590411 [Xylariaceae sp. FL0662B]|nr:hypothetical protein F4779DRAFT_590411 [Xylariaceae sp. FL0662B]